MVFAVSMRTVVVGLLGLVMPVPVQETNIWFSGTSADLQPTLPPDEISTIPFPSPSGPNEGVFAEATLIVGYKGLIALARRSGEIESVSVRVVREGDKFRVSFGHDEIIEHVPDLAMKGKATHYYAIIRYKGGGTSFEVLTREQTDATRARSRASESSCCRASAFS
jgi:phage RecT family recombinase